jgi:hypothetical protein
LAVTLNIKTKLFILLAIKLFVVMNKLNNFSDCGSPSNVTNGQLNVTSTTYGSNASLVCDNGYYGNKGTITCLDTGIWETSTCTIKGVL